MMVTVSVNSLLVRLKCMAVPMNMVLATVCVGMSMLDVNLRFVAVSLLDLDADRSRVS